MTCFHPIDCYRQKGGGITFSRKNAYIDQPLKIPCGQCIGCRLERSRQWAIRCVHEASLYKNNIFITLTYSDEHLPRDNSLHLEHFQNFMKRLRKKYGENIRFYHCGEYGEQTQRPHYHACIFNFDFEDKKIWRRANGNNLYNSESLSKLWPYGYAVIGEVTFQSAAYVARYIMKKVTGKNSEAHYERIDQETGEIYQLKPEYTTMSRRPGIGSDWFKKYQKDVFPQDRVIMNEKKMRPPKYYDRQFELLYPSDFEKIKSRRKINSKKHLTNNTEERLIVREQVQRLRLTRLIRQSI